MNKLFLGMLGLVSLTSLGCGKVNSAAEWQAAVAPSVEARKPALAKCFADEQRRVDALTDNPAVKKQIEAFLAKPRIQITITLDQSPWGTEDQTSWEKGTLYVNTRDSRGGKDDTGIDQPGGHKEADGPLIGCVEKVMRGIKNPYPDQGRLSPGTWRIVFDHSLPPQTQ